MGPEQILCYKRRWHFVIREASESLFTTSHSAVRHVLHEVSPLKLVQISRLNPTNDTIFVFGRRNHSSATDMRLILRRFQPDYTLAEIDELLILNTTIGRMTVPIIVRIPQRALATCYRNIPRPLWEPRIYFLSLLSGSFLLALVLVAAIMEATQLYYGVSRTRWTTNGLDRWCFIF